MLKKILLWTLLAIVLIVGFFYINLAIFEKRGSIVTEGTPIENYQSNNSALLVIDIQEYTTGEVSITEVFKTAADDLIRRINMITEKSAENGIPVIYIRSEISNPLINLMNNSMAVGSLGAQLDRRLNILSDYVIPKEKQDAFSNSYLDSILIESEISRLFVVGLDAAFCVNSTIEGARNRGYDIAVISDATISDPDSMKNFMLDEFVNRGVEILNTQEFFVELQNGK
ncbi:MAG: cysteine hydrolase [Bacteroidales bacterium]|nr:cysteine hydrolase [Bacteroidales bacterium]